MLFDIRYFEQFLSERVLKKGLRLFESGKVEFIGRQQAGESQFVIDTNFTLSLKKKGDKLTGYTCSCGKEAYCEHLAAVMFYFQQDALGLSVKKRAEKKSGNTAGKIAKKTPVKIAFEIYADTLKDLLKPYLKTKAVNQSQLDKLYKACVSLSSGKKQAGTRYDLSLAFLAVVPSVFELRILGDETKLRELLKETCRALKKEFDAGLSESQQQAWYAATLESVRNNIILRSEAFLFLVPRIAVLLKDKTRLEKLRSALESRRYKMNYASRFNKLLIAKLEIALRESKLFKTPVPSEYHASEVELIIAKTELDLCSHKITTAFNRLSLNHDLVKQYHPFYYSAYLEYIIEKAREENKPHIEINYLEKSFIHNAHILPAHLKRFMELVPASDLAPIVNELVAWLKNKPQVFTFDKIADLLFMTNRLDELVDEIRRQENKFSLLHKVLLQKLPRYDGDTLDLYTEQLLQALAEANYYHFQQRIFEKAKEYLDQLPGQVKQQVISKLLDGIGRSKQIYRYVQFQ